MKKFLPERYFGEEVDLEQRIFYFAAVIGTVTSVIGLLQAICIKPLLRYAIILCAVCAAVFSACTLYGYITTKTKTAGFLMMIVLNFFELPALFFLTGGIRGSVALYALMGILFIAVALDGAARHIIFALSGIVFLTAMGLSALFPQLVTPLSEQSAVVGAIGSFAVVGATIYAVTSLLRSAHIHDQQKVQTLNRQLETLAQTDPLTAVYNRRYLNSYIEQLIAQNECDFSVALIDFDNFKALNDTYGHVYGDTVLVRLADILREMIVDRGIAARFGGEEFMVVFCGRENEEIARLLKESAAQLLAFGIETKKAEVTFSGGVEPYRGQSAVKLFDQADQKLYAAKRQGKNRVVFASPGKENEQEMCAYGISN